jgi:hypothetical protein
MEMAQLMCGKGAKLQIAQIPISSDITYDRTKHMSEDIRGKVVEQLQRSRQKSVCSWVNQMVFQIALNFSFLLGTCDRIT